MIWHNSAAEEVISELNTDREKGLRTEAAATRLSRYGKNELNDIKQKKFFKYLLSELKSFISIALAVTAAIFFVVSLVTEDAGWLDSVMILAALIIQMVVTAVAKYKADGELGRLRNSVGTTATVIRDGEEKVIPSSELVPGDIMLLKNGDYVPADGRLIDSYVLTCDEFKLTGESVPEEKVHDILFDDITPLEARSNMVYSGSCVVNGRGVAVVTETGYLTELGKREKISRHTDTTLTPLGTKLARFSHLFSVGAIVSAIIIFVIGIIANFSSYEVSFASTVLGHLLLALAVCTAALPDTIRAILAVTTAFSVSRLQKKEVTVKNFRIAEEIKDVTVICADKTGTFTTGDMSVVKLYTADTTYLLDGDTIDDAAANMLRLALICSNFNPSQHTERHANDLESAIEAASIKYIALSKNDIDGLYPKIAELPFDSERRLMTTVSAINGQPYAIVKGAPEVVLDRCHGIDAERLSAKVQEFAAEGLMVLALALKPLGEIPANPNCDELENDLTLVGLICFEDPVLPDAATLCSQCKSAGLKVVMITGDHNTTAKAVAEKIGILSDDSEAISGAELATLTDEELAACVHNYSVFARVSPQDKLRIVTAFRTGLEKVAVTGDSINDTPAMLEADIGCALGLTASDMVKDSADLVLSNNRFSALISAVKESGRILTGVKKSLSYMLSGNIAEVLVVLFGLIIFGRSPLSAAALLFVNLLTDILPALAFSAERVGDEEGVTRHATTFGKSFFGCLAAPSLIITVLALVAYGLALPLGEASASAATLGVVIVGELVHAFGVSLKNTVFSTATLRNLSMPVACGISLIVLILFLVTPAGALLSLKGMGAAGWLMVIISAVAVFLADEATKLADFFAKK